MRAEPSLEGFVKGSVVVAVGGKISVGGVVEDENVREGIRT